MQEVQDHVQPGLQAAAIVGTDVEVRWHDGRSSRYPALWLRDNARDPVSFDARSHQRELWTAELDPAITPLQVSVGGDGLQVTWPDVPEPVHYAAAFLRAHAAPGTAGAAPAAIPWAQGEALPITRVAHDDLAARVPELLAALARDGCALVTDCPLEPASVARVAARIGYVRETLFGGVWTFAANEDMADSAYTSKTLRPHTDGTYSHDAPGVQVLLCLEAAEAGGASVLVDGLALAEDLRRDDPAVFADLATLPVTGEYVGDGAHLKATRPVLRLGVDGGVQQVSFNNYDRAPDRLPDDDQARLYAAMRAFDHLANDPARQWRHTLAAGEMLVFDNWRLLHGRDAFSGGRRMAGCYINREDLESAWRTRAIV